MNKFQQGLGMASQAVGALPVVGSFLGPLLGIGSTLAGAFGQTPEEEQRKRSVTVAPQGTLAQGGQVASGGNPNAGALNGPGEMAALAQPVINQSPASAQGFQLQEPMTGGSSLQNAQSQFLAKLLFKNEEQL